MRCCLLPQGILNTQYSWLQGRLACQIRAAVTCCVFKKTLLLSQTELGEFAAGGVQTLMAVDADRVRCAAAKGMSQRWDPCTAAAPVKHLRCIIALLRWWQRQHSNKCTAAMDVCTGNVPMQCFLNPASLTVKPAHPAITHAGGEPLRIRARDMVASAADCGCIGPHVDAGASAFVLALIRFPFEVLQVFFD